MDRVSPAVRSRMMSGIRGKDTRPELIVRSYLHRAGLRFRLHDRTLPGRPDIVLPRHRAVVLVHGCFWHHHAGCRFAYMPKSREAFWRHKLSANVLRDQQNEDALRQAGWRVFVVWECETSEARLSELYKEIVLHKDVTLGRGKAGTA